MVLEKISLLVCLLMSVIEEVHNIGIFNKIIDLKYSQYFQRFIQILLCFAEISYEFKIKHTKKNDEFDNLED